MRQRGRPRRSSMPAVAHNRVSDCPYSRQHQSPPESEQCSRQQFYFHSGGPDSGDEQEADSQQLSDHYSRIQLVDNWPPFAHHSQFPFDASSNQQYQQFFTQEDEQNFSEIDPELMNYSYMEKSEDAQQSQDDDDDDDESEGPTGTKRKRALSTCALASTTNTMTASNSAIMSGLATTSGNTGAGQSSEKRTATKICRVCGDKAYSYNFNVITCESCKAFFRRNANKEREIRCPFNEQCDINIVSRRFCQRCRLQKCFRVGMKKEWIMSDEARLEKKQRIQENRERRAAAANITALGTNSEQPQQELKTERQQTSALLIAAAAQAQQQLKQEETFLLAANNNDLTLPTYLQQQQNTQSQVQQPGTAAPSELYHQQQQQNQVVVENLPTQQQPIPDNAPTLPTNPSNQIPIPAATALSNPFLQPSSATTAMNASLLGAAAAAVANNDQVMAAAAAHVAAAAQVCAVQQAVNILQQQQIDQQQQQQQFHFEPPSQLQHLQQPEESTSVSIHHPGIGIPMAGNSNIYAAIASNDPTAMATAAAVPSAASMTDFIQPGVTSQQKQDIENPNDSQQPMGEAIAALQIQQHNQSAASLLTSTTPGTAPSIESTVSVMMAPNADGMSTNGVLPPAAAVAAAIIQQQQNNQIMAAAALPATNTAAAAIAHQQAAAANAVIQQQIASQVVAAHQVQQLAEQHHQLQQQQAVAAAAAVAQLQQQAQAQQQAAQIVAHAQQVVQQQQQLAAFANAAVMHHHAQQTAAAATASLYAGTAPPPANPVDTVNQQLHQVASSINTAIGSSSNGSPASTAPPVPSVLPTIIEVATKLASQPVSQASIAPTLSSNQAAATANPLLPPFVAASAQAAAAATANLLIQQQTQQPSAPTALITSLNSAQSMTQPTQSTANETIPGVPSAQVILSQIPGQSNIQPQQQAMQQQEMVSVPKDVLIKLVEQRLEAEHNQMQTPNKCQCHCQCGRYPSEMLIVDKVMSDLLESSSKHLNNGDSQSSNNSTPRLSQQFSSGHFQNVNGQQNWSHPQQQPMAPVEAMDTNSVSRLLPNVQQQLTAADQEQLAELSKANEIWNNFTATTCAGVPNAAEMQFLLGQYTDSDLRRLIALAKSLESFKRLDQHDQEHLLKGCFGSFFVLRSLLKVDSTNEYSLAMMRKNGVLNHIIKFYTDFPAEWRHNETVNMLLGMLLLFNVGVGGLQSPISVTVENMKFESLLKRLLFVLCDQDSARADAAHGELIMQIEQLKQIFPISNNASQATMPSSNPIGGNVQFGQQQPNQIITEFGQTDSINSTTTITNNPCEFGSNNQ